MSSPDSPFESYSNALLEEGVARIEGLSELVAHLARAGITVDGKEHRFVVFDESAVSRDGQGNVTGLEDTAADILLGGGGSDILQGKAGNDVIDGDRWLDVRIRINDAQGREIGWSDNLSGKVYSAAGALLYGGRTLDSLMFDRTLNPGQLSIVREILDGDPLDTAVDQAVYRGNRAEYEIEHNEDGSVTVRHAAPVAGGFDDGTDRLFNIERLVFADGTVSLVAPDIVGTEGADVLAGGDLRDRIFGLGGDDVLLGGAGNDRMDGGLGNDYLDGGAGADQMAGGEDNDFMVGGAGDDQLAGDGGHDVLRGDAGNDRIAGGLGDDYLDGGDGDDQLLGEQGNDFLVGGAGNDQMAGGDGDDILRGDAGNDRLDGGLGTDYLDGGAGDDQLIGGQGNDFLDGGAGADHMAGGEGDDTYLVDSDADVIVEQAGEGVDWVRSSVASHGLAANVDNLVLMGSAVRGVGNELANWMAGNELDNVLIGNGGDDVLNGGRGNDILIGGEGHDIFVFHESFGHDRVDDFDAGIDGGQDRIDISALGITAADFEALVAITTSAGATLVTIGGQTISFTGVDGIGGNAITQSDFMLA